MKAIQMYSEDWHKLPSGKWIHIVEVSENDETKLYIDGKLIQ